MQPKGLPLVTKCGKRVAYHSDPLRGPHRPPGVGYGMGHPSGGLFCFRHLAACRDRAIISYASPPGAINHNKGLRVNLQSTIHGLAVFVLHSSVRSLYGLANRGGNLHGTDAQSQLS